MTLSLVGVPLTTVYSSGSGNRTFECSISCIVWRVLLKGRGRKNMVPLHALRELYSGTLAVYAPSLITLGMLNELPAEGIQLRRYWNWLQSIQNTTWWQYPPPYDWLAIVTHVEPLHVDYAPIWSYLTSATLNYQVIRQFYFSHSLSLKPLFTATTCMLWISLHFFFQGSYHSCMFKE